MPEIMSPKREKLKKAGSSFFNCLSAPCGLPRQPSTPKTSTVPNQHSDFTAKNPHIQEVNRYAASHSQTSSRQKSGTFSGTTKPMPTMVEVHIRFATGSNVDVPLHVSTQETMVALKIRLQNMQGLRAETIRLMWRGKELPDSDTVEGVGLASNGGTLYLLTWPPGRAPKLDETLVKEAHNLINLVTKADNAPLLNVAGEDTPTADTADGTNTRELDFGESTPKASQENRREAVSRTASGGWRYLSFFRRPERSGSQRFYECH
mmetsp:Transcript_30133/g.70286  ORF Transcript_30133/g.70286 Transcript_30133/m.70286 type:complete len:263 (+) Transcript_30133:90-878(+)